MQHSVSGVAVAEDRNLTTMAPNLGGLHNYGKSSVFLPKKKQALTTPSFLGEPAAIKNREKKAADDIESSDDEENQKDPFSYRDADEEEFSASDVDDVLPKSKRNKRY
jgi:hypothetical protein